MSRTTAIRWNDLAAFARSAGIRGTRSSGSALSSLTLLLFLFALPACATVIESISSRGRNVVKRYTLDGNPGGIALSQDGILYVGMSNNQSVIAIDPKTDEIVREVILDDPDIAATKDLVTLRIDQRNNRLVIAQGSDESVTILALPNLGIEREITLEGELIRDAVPDPLGRYIFVLGRSVHVFDSGGDRIIRTIRDVDPMAIAVSEDGRFLAVVGSEEFSAGRATVVSLWNLAELREVSRDPLQTDRDIRAAIFAASGRAIVVAADDWFAEKPVEARRESARLREDQSGVQRIQFSFGDLVSSDTICLSPSAGPQALVPDLDGLVVYFPEKRCGESGSFTGSKRMVWGAPIYGVDLQALARERHSGRIWATDPRGTVTLYEAPKPRKP